MTDVLTWLEDRTPDILDYLRQLVEIESPSDDPRATAAINEFLGSTLLEMGFECRTVSVDGAGPHLVASLGAGDGGLLVLSHVDTVWAAGETGRRPFRIEGDLAYGPGISDMKGGIAQLVFALRALGALGVRPARPVTLVFNTDEEVGSLTSRALIEDCARRSSHVLVLEPAIGPEGLIKTFRKGVGGFEITATGVAAHSGADHSLGVNAVEELAWQTLKLQAMTDYACGTTVNVGVVSGGTRSNVVPAAATARVDVRVSTMAEAARIEKAILGLRPMLEGAGLQVRGGLNRPPMERTPAIVRLFERARAMAADMGFDLKEGGTGGASDGNFTAALGVPTLDGLGAVGGGGHALHEHVKVSCLAPRAALVARLLAGL